MVQPQLKECSYKQQGSIRALPYKQSPSTCSTQQGMSERGPCAPFPQRGTEHCPPPLMLSSVCSHHYYCSTVIHGITAMGNTTITCVRAWMLVLMSPLATWEIIKLIVDAVLLCISSKCGETARILESGAKENIKLLQGILMSWNYAIPH